MFLRLFNLDLESLLKVHRLLCDLSVFMSEDVPLGLRLFLEIGDAVQD